LIFSPGSVFRGFAFGSLVFSGGIKKSVFGRATVMKEEREQNKSYESLRKSLEAAVQEILGLGYITLQMGNFVKLEGLVFAARLIVDVLGDACPAGVLERLGRLEAVLSQREKGEDWVI